MNQIEYLVLKWTFGAVFLGSTLIFLMKLLWLFESYFESGQAVFDLKDFAAQVLREAWEGVQKR